MTMDMHMTEDNVDHFLISTREDQLLFVWLGPEASETKWEN